MEVQDLHIEISGQTVPLPLEEQQGRNWTTTVLETAALAEEPDINTARNEDTTATEQNNRGNNKIEIRISHAVQAKMVSNMEALSGRYSELNEQNITICRKLPTADKKVEKLEN